VMPTGAISNSIDMLARISATAVANNPGLYQLRVEVRSPANVPLMTGTRTNTPPVTFTSLFYSP
jgi:hypothetical protein